MTSTALRLRNHARDILAAADRFERIEARLVERSAKLLAEAAELVRETEARMEIEALAQASKSIAELETRDERIDLVIGAVAAATSVPVTDILGHSRRGRISEARFFAMHASRVLLGLPFQRIADAFLRHHTAAVHAEERIAALRQTDRHYSARLDRAMEAAKKALGRADGIAA